MHTPFRKKLLEAILATDAQSPFISPPPLVDALVTLMAELDALIGNRAIKEWMRKEELKRHFNITEYRVQQVLNNYHVPKEITRAGVTRYNVAAFEKCLSKAI